MQRNFLAMLLEEFLTVTSFAIGLICGSGFGIIDDMLFQRGDLCQTFLGLCDLGLQLIPPFYCFIDKSIDLFQRFRTAFVEQKHTF